MNENVKRYYTALSTINTTETILAKTISIISATSACVIKSAIKIAIWTMLAVWLVGILNILDAQVVNNQASNSDDNIDMIEMVDYRRNLLIGYIVFKNGRAKEKIILKEPIPFDKSNPPEKPTPTDLTQLEQKAQQNATRPQSLTAQSQQPNQKTALKLDSASKQNSQNKYSHIKKSKDFIANSSIEQIVGQEARMLNELYKNREWNKKLIIYEIDTRVLNIRD